VRPPTLPARARERKASENPYVGPRALRSDNELFGRDAETLDLQSLLMAERIVLLHAPSGAGKTSLIQAGLIPSLEKAVSVTGPLRVNVLPANSEDNPYLSSAMLGLITQWGRAPEAKGSFSDWLTALEELHGMESHLLIFDQFEELVTLDPTDRDGQHEFCREVGEALQAMHRSALFSMREDYMGGLDHYLGLIPTRLRVRYRLDFLGWDAAREAAQEPARARGVEFTDAAADVLVGELGKLRIERPGREFVEKTTSIEPVQLQVVCHTVWNRLADERGRDFDRIAAEDVEGQDDFMVALSGYFAQTVAKAARKSRVGEAAVRHWFGEKLITAQGFRSQTCEAPKTNGGNKEKLLELLEKRYLIRGDDRRDGVRWYELSHDTLVEPVRVDNRSWFRAKHGPWMEFAWDWREANKDRALLLRGQALGEATAWLETHQQEADDLVREFLEASLDAAARQTSEAIPQTWITRVSYLVLGLLAIVVIETAIIAYLLAR
jgi:hypothetical protein